MNIRVLASMLLLTGCERSSREERTPELLDKRSPNPVEDVKVIEGQSLSFILEYPSPPPEDSGTGFQNAIKDLSKRLEGEGITFNTQGFLGNQFHVHGRSTLAKKVLLEYSKTSEYKLTFLTQIESEQAAPSNR